ncbi:glia maturation factor gamma isoform X7 [Sapajus apella]|uniref:Glia maturation factor gamma isoform X6 n=1 Tax=Sapajus apella TaxID=9515 RepID=A0A6J3FGJ8_SAPAP|nr:glia maturation factor gamma isoform X6 [Sapajus apella]XP_032104726.1 glia maturation factor gamma isoform X7 [Sapajus apella]
MSDSLVVCEVDPELREKLRKFRFRKETDNAAIIMKVDKDRQMVVLEEEFQVRGLQLQVCARGWPSVLPFVFHLLQPCGLQAGTTDDVCRE